MLGMHSSRAPLEAQASCHGPRRRSARSLEMWKCHGEMWAQLDKKKDATAEIRTGANGCHCQDKQAWAARWCVFACRIAAG